MAKPEPVRVEVDLTQVLGALEATAAAFRAIAEEMDSAVRAIESTGPDGGRRP